MGASARVCTEKGYDLTVLPGTLPAVSKTDLKKLSEEAVAVVKDRDDGSQTRVVTVEGVKNDGLRYIVKVLPVGFSCT